MRKVIFVLLACFILGTGTAFQTKAQIKIGHINSTELFMAMPERDSAMLVLEQQKQAILKQSEELSVEYNRKLELYINQRDSLSPLVVKTKEDELRDFQNRIELLRLQQIRRCKISNKLYFNQFLTRHRKL